MLLMALTVSERIQQRSASARPALDLAGKEARFQLGTVEMKIPFTLNLVEYFIKALKKKITKHTQRDTQFSVHFD